MENYKIENYTNPWSLYKNISKRLKLGHLVYDLSLKNIRLVDHELLGEILKSELVEPEKKSNFTIPILTEEWLLKVFDFEDKFNAPNNMTVFTSKRNGLKIHKNRNGFFIAISVRENYSTMGMTGSHVSKPMILTVNELLDYVFLLKRDDISFNERDIDEINRIIYIH